MAQAPKLLGLLYHRRRYRDPGVVTWRRDLRRATWTAWQSCALQPRARHLSSAGHDRRTGRRCICGSTLRVGTVREAPIGVLHADRLRLPVFGSRRGIEEAKLVETDCDRPALAIARSRQWRDGRLCERGQHRGEAVAGGWRAFVKRSRCRGGLHGRERGRDRHGRQPLVTRSAASSRRCSSTLRASRRRSRAAMSLARAASASAARRNPRVRSLR